MTPLSTYRVQVRPGFDLVATAGLAGYLSRARRRPSLHRPAAGRHARLRARVRRGRPPLRRPGRGGEAGRRALVAALREAGLGLVVDIVPNHAGIAVRRPTRPGGTCCGEGPGSAYASWFDIDWARGPILLPVLADDGDLDALRIEDGELRYYEHRFPIADGTGERRRRARCTTGSTTGWSTGVAATPS